MRKLMIVVINNNGEEWGLRVNRYVSKRQSGRGTPQRYFLKIVRRTQVPLEEQQGNDQRQSDAEYRHLLSYRYVHSY